jgi:hypothetical protein
VLSDIAGGDFSHCSIRRDQAGSSRLPSAAQREEDIRLIVGERLVGGSHRRFSGCEVCLGIEHVEDSSSAEADQGGRLAARGGGAVTRLSQLSIMVDLANLAVERCLGLLKGR